MSLCKKGNESGSVVLLSLVFLMSRSILYFKKYINIKKLIINFNFKIIKIKKFIFKMNFFIAFYRMYSSCAYVHTYLNMYLNGTSSCIK